MATARAKQEVVYGILFLHPHQIERVGEVSRQVLLDPLCLFECRTFAADFPCQFFELARDAAVDDGAPVQISRKGGVEATLAIGFAPDGGFRIDGEPIDARHLAPGHWSLVDEDGHHEAIVERRGKSGIDVVMRGTRLALKWKPAGG